MLQSEKILHEKIRNKVQDLTPFGVDKFTLATIDETDMSYVLTQIPDRFFAKKRDFKRWFHRESEYRKTEMITLQNGETLYRNQFDEIKDSLVELGNTGFLPIQGKLDLGADFDIDKKPKTSNMKKTILVIYTNRKDENPGYKQRYAFNCSDAVEIGDMVKSPNYSTNLQVVEVLDESYKYFNKSTGELSNRVTNSNAFPIRTLKITDSSEDVVMATRL